MSRRRSIIAGILELVVVAALITYLATTVFRVAMGPPAPDVESPPVSPSLEIP